MRVEVVNKYLSKKVYVARFLQILWNCFFKMQSFNHSNRTVGKKSKISYNHITHWRFSAEVTASVQVAVAADLDSSPHRWYVHFCFSPPLVPCVLA